MIRINLLKNQLAGAEAQSVELGGINELTADSQKEAAIRLGVIMLFPILLIVYEQFNISSLKGDLKKKNMQSARLEAEITKLGPVVKEVERFIKEKERLQEKFEIIGKLSEARLTKVKAMDNLQLLIPKDAWFQNISIDEKKVELKGEALQHDAILELVKGLEESIFFKDVVLTSSVEKKTQAGVLKTFEIVSMLEGTN